MLFLADEVEAGAGAEAGTDEVSGADTSDSGATEEENEGMDVVDDGTASDAGISSTTGTEDTESATTGEADSTEDEVSLATFSPQASFC